MGLEAPSDIQPLTESCPARQSAPCGSHPQPHARAGTGAEAAVTAVGSWGDALLSLLWKLKILFACCHPANMLALEPESGSRICAFSRFALLFTMALNLNPSVNKGWYSLLTVYRKLHPFGHSQVKRKECGKSRRTQLNAPPPTM